MPTSQQSPLSYAELKSLLQLINPERDTITCVGTAKSTGVRCLCRIAAENRCIAKDIVRELPRVLRNRSVLRTELYELAERTLCKGFHQNQASRVTEKWYKKVVQEVARRSPPPSRSRDSSAERQSIPATAVDSSSVSTEPSTPRANPSAAIQITPSCLSNGADHDHSHDHSRSTESGRATSSREEDPCDICYEPLTDPCQTPCGHKFCRECVSEWLKNHHTCPYDRRPLRLTDLVPVAPAIAEDTACVVCCGAFVEPCRTPCGHTFCRECISTWLRDGSRRTCPLDRRPLKESDLVSIPQS